MTRRRGPDKQIQCVLSVKMCLFSTPIGVNMGAQTNRLFKTCLIVEKEIFVSVAALCPSQ